MSSSTTYSMVRSVYDAISVTLADCTLIDKNQERDRLREKTSRRVCEMIDYMQEFNPTEFAPAVEWQ